MTEAIKLIVLEREPKAYADGSVPGILHVGPESFPTIERGQGYVSLKIGDYVMVHSWKWTGRRVKCLRPVEPLKRFARKGEKTIETILIHDAKNDDSLQLSGCISPGMVKKGGRGMGIRRAAEAMERIWELLGGFHEGKRVTLHVASNVPHELRTKETWDRVQRLRARELSQP
ncbi:MAG: hypothetical protein ACE5F1_04740 [Planctomycetota bacterium]